MARERYTVNYKTFTIGKASTVYAEGTCPVSGCSHDYKSDVGQFKRHMRVHLSNTHSALPRWNGTKRR